MSKVVEQARDQVRDRILQALGGAVAAGELPAEPIPDFGIEVPGDRAHGALRVSMGRLTTERDVVAFAEAMDTVLNWK